MKANLSYHIRSTPANYKICVKRCFPNEKKNGWAVTAAQDV
jgi:hypothetical protein